MQIGKTGLSPGVKEELDRALCFHELIKVRLLSECPIPRAEAGNQLASNTRSEHIQTLGGVLLLYRARPKDPRIELPGPGATRSATVEVAPKKARKRNGSVPSGRKPGSNRSSPSGFKTKKQTK